MSGVHIPAPGQTGTIFYKYKEHYFLILLNVNNVLESFLRYIVHNDVHNPMISSFDAFDKILSTYEPNLLVVSGLQMMDNYPFPNGNNSHIFSYTIPAS